MTTLVLLPGMDGTGELFAPLIQALGGTISVVALKYPSARSLSYHELEAIVRSDLPNDPFVLLGESFSGPIAISIASANPNGLLGLILCCSFASSPRPSAAAFTALLTLPLPVPPPIVLAPLLMGNFGSGRLRRMLSHALNEVKPDVLRHRLASTLRVDVEQKMAAITVPVCYLQASEDRLVPTSAARKICAVSPQTQVTVIRGPHMLLQANPTDSASAIKAFIAALD